MNSREFVGSKGEGNGTRVEFQATAAGNRLQVSIGPYWYTFDNLEEAEAYLQAVKTQVEEYRQAESMSMTDADRED